MTPDEVQLLAHVGNATIENIATLICDAVLYGKPKYCISCYTTVYLNQAGVYMILVLVALYSLWYASPIFITYCLY